MDGRLVEIAWEMLFDNLSPQEVLAREWPEIKNNPMGIYGWLTRRQLEKTHEALALTPSAALHLTPVGILIKEANLRLLFDMTMSEILLRLEKAMK